MRNPRKSHCAKYLELASRNRLLGKYIVACQYVFGGTLYKTCTCYEKSQCHLDIVEPVRGSRQIRRRRGSLDNRVQHAERISNVAHLEPRSIIAYRRLLSVGLHGSDFLNKDIPWIVTRQTREREKKKMTKKVRWAKNNKLGESPDQSKQSWSSDHCVDTGTRPDRCGRFEKKFHASACFGDTRCMPHHEAALFMHPQRRRARFHSASSLFRMACEGPNAKTYASPPLGQRIRGCDRTISTSFIVFGFPYIFNGRHDSWDPFLRLSYKTTRGIQ